MATVTETPAGENSSTSRRRGRKAKPNYIDSLEGDVKKLGSCPDVPDEYDPDVYSPLKETDFDDTLHYYQWKAAYHGYFADKAATKAEELEKMDPEVRNDFAAAMKSTDSVITELSRLAAAGHDISGILAKITSSVN